MTKRKVKTLSFFRAQWIFVPALICFCLTAFYGASVRADDLDGRRFKPLHADYSAKLTFFDGTPVSRCSDFGETFRAELIEYPPGFVQKIEIERDGQKMNAGTNVPAQSAIKSVVVNKPGGTGYLSQDSGTDPSGKFYLRIDYPGRYRLKLGDIDIMEFEAVLSKGGLDFKPAPDQEVRLPFNYLIKTDPGVDVHLYEPSGKKIKTLSGNAAGLIPWNAPTAAPPDRLIVTAPQKAAPNIAQIKPLKPEQMGDMRQRYIRISAGCKGDIHNIVSDIYVKAWASHKKIARDRFFWLQIYDAKQEKGWVSAISIPVAVNWDKALPPLLYLDEKGSFRAYFQYEDPKIRKKVGQSYAIMEGFNGLQPVDDDYPLFRFKGFRIKGTGWLIPNFRGIPFAEGGGNAINLSCRFSAGQDMATQTFSIIYDKEKNGYRFDPERIFPVLKGEASKSDLEDCSLTVRGTTFGHYSHKDPMAAKSCAYQKHPEESGYASHEACAKALMERAKVQMGFGPDEDGIGYGIHLIDNEGGAVSAAGPINLREGPYPELRYRASRKTFFASEQAARKACKKPRYRTSKKGKTYYCEEQYVQKVCPDNYSWRLEEGGKILPNFKALYCGEKTQADDAAATTEAPQLKILSPDPERDSEIVAGTHNIVYITAEYHLGSAKSGRIAILAETAKRKLATRNIPVTSAEDKKQILFPVVLEDNESILSVTLTLIPEGSKTGPVEVVRYVSIVGPFQVTFDLKDPIPAHPKNKTEITFTVTKKDGAPVAQRDFTVIPLALTVPYVEGGQVSENTRSSVEAKTDANGKIKIVYVPPGVVKKKISRMSDPSLFFTTTQRIEFRDRANTSQKTVVEIPLCSPYPKIAKLGVPGGDLAGTWQKNPSIVTIEDKDSDTFKITVWGRGEFGYAGGHGYDEELVAENQHSPFKFRFKSEAMGFDVTDLPDVAAEFGKTNQTIFTRYAALLGGKKLLEAFWVRGSKMQKFIKTADGAEIPFTPENIARCEDKGFFVVNKMVTPTGTWATKAVDAGDYIAGAQKNLREGADTYANQISEQKLAARDKTGMESADVALEGVHSTVGMLDTYQSLADLVNGSPMDPYSEALKIIYENAKTFYGLHRKFQDAAESWEDVMFMPIMVEVEDSEGHAVRRMAKYAVKYVKKAE